MLRTNCGLYARLTCLHSPYGLAAAVACLCIMFARPAMAQSGIQHYWFVDLGISGNANANAINNLGQVVGSTDGSAFFWQNGTLTYLTNVTSANGINASGQIVGVGSNSHAVLWQNGVLTDLGTLGGNYSQAYAINASGQIVGAASKSTGGGYPVLWPNGNFPIALSSTSGTAYGINDKNQIVGTLLTDPLGRPGNQAFFWENGTQTFLHAASEINPDWSFAKAINNSGQVAGYSDSFFFGLTATSWEYNLRIGDFEPTDLSINTYADYSQASDVNDMGQIVGTIYDALGNFPSGYFVGQKGSPLIDLGSLVYNFPSGNFGLVAINAINNAGQIVGAYSDGNQNYACLLTPINAPTPDHGGNPPDAGEVTVTIVYPNVAHVVGVTLTALAPQQNIVATNIRYRDSLTLLATFNLMGKAAGPRGVVLTLDDGTQASLPKNFMVQDGGAPQVWVDILGQNTIHVEREKTYQIAVGNKGNVDALDVPVWIALDNLPEGSRVSVDLTFTDLPGLTELPGIDLNSFSRTIQGGGEFLEPFLIPRVPPDTTFFVQVRITVPVPGQISIRAWANDVYHLIYPHGVQADALNAYLRAITEQVYQAASGVLPPANDPAVATAVGKVATQMQTLLDTARQGNNLNGPLTSLTNLLEASALLTAYYRHETLDTTALQTAIALVFSSPNSASFFDQEVVKSLSVVAGNSDDPNQLSGPLSFHDPMGTNFLNGKEPLQFTIGFNNDGNAPAADIVIKDTLDQNQLDLTGLTVGNLNLEYMDANKKVQNVTRPPNIYYSPLNTQNRSYFGYLNVPSPSDPHVETTVLVEAGVDLTSGQITWHFSALGLTDFLPKGLGGSVTFSVPWKSGLGMNSSLQNYAQVIFDSSFNMPVPTNTLTYTLDNVPPVSSVKPLPAMQSSIRFPIQWSGSDTGSGVSTYTIFVSEDSVNWTPCPGLTSVPASQTQAYFFGVPGHTYYFKSVAVDNVGNAETDHSNGDTTTTIAANAPLITIGGVVTLQGCKNAVQPITFELRPADGSEPFTRSTTLEASGAFHLPRIPGGVYNLAIKGDRWLRQVVAVDGSHGDVSSVMATLKAGDANNDNTVDLADFGVLVNAYLSTASDPDSPYDIHADFNCDGSIDIGDFGLLTANFGSSGDL